MGVPWPGPLAGREQLVLVGHAIGVLHACLCVLAIEALQGQGGAPAAQSATRQLQQKPCWVSTLEVPCGTPLLMSDDCPAQRRDNT